ncbi:NACHT C-terminal helical domain 2-containing protein [Rivularia sp. UHCC 0363]|uniref:NACHT C-terminal helical domain 2-containing protein n=1 Tax=Rivularia sp. UHCC 0363 TaxID=3110244 RepID=UPI002B21CBEB|nr:hypothetical protein [Rivularia sp. UHCC 0363]MEA5595326.1 hypothetical protein [Rivularia sp. UHCC 0363]
MNPPYNFKKETISKSLYYSLIASLTRAFEPKLKQALQKMSNDLPNPEIDIDKFCVWWKVNGQKWTKLLREIMIEHRNIGYDWQFNKEQQDLLHKYCFANKVIVDCLNSDLYITPKVRSHIEDTLLLPITEIEKRKLTN